MGARWSKAVSVTIVFGLGATMALAQSAHQADAQNERRVLSEEATITGMALSSLGRQFRQSMDAALDTTLEIMNGQKPSGVGAGNLGADPSFTQNTSMAAVVRSSPTSPWTVAGSFGAPLLAGQNGQQLPVAALGAGGFHISGIIGAGDQRRLAVVDTSGPDATVGVYAEVALGALAPASSTPGLERLEYAVYTTASEDSGDAVMATTTKLPLRGTRAVIPISLEGADFSQNHAEVGVRPGEAVVAPDRYLLVVTAKDNLTGPLGRSLPWLVLAGGLLITIGAAAVTALGAGRRRETQQLVADLREKNADLDRAVADHARAEQARSALEEQLRQAHRLEAVGQLAGGIAHDFNNLLAVILTYADFASGALDGHPAQDDIAEIRRAGRRAADLTRQLLQFSRRDHVNAAPVCLSAVVGDAERMLGRLLGEDIELVSACEPNVPLVLADAGEIEQVVVNLTLNARDAMPDGGRIDLEVTSDGTWVQISVSDTGIGMDEELRARIFDPFFTTKPLGQGTGMGLAIVYGIVERWGGHITVVSAVGTGSVFRVALPIASPSDIDGTDAALPAAGSAGHDGQGRRVLLVEDEEQVRKATRRILEGGGFVVDDRASGVAALAALSHTDASAYDLLLTDVIMPGGVSGKELARRLKQGSPDLPVVYMSGYTADVIATRGDVEEGAALIAKPFTAEELLDAVHAGLAATTRAAR